MTKNNIIASNHQALYIQIRAVSVLYLLSIKVPKIMATAKLIKRKAIKRVEKRMASNFFSITGQFGF